MRRVLPRTPFLTGLFESALRVIAHTSTPRHYGRNQVIIKDGECGNVFCPLIAGAVHVPIEGYRGQAIALGVLYPNDLFEEMGPMSYHCVHAVALHLARPHRTNKVFDGLPSQRWYLRTDLMHTSTTADQRGSLHGSGRC
jgi:hypothetical protein